MTDSDQPQARRFVLHRVPNSLIVLLAVALLLRGPAGAFDAFWNYTTSLLQALFGGEAVFIEVICQTAPLTLSAAAITFLYRCKVLTFQSVHSIVGCCVIIIAATWAGGQLRSLTATRIGQTDEQPSAAPTESPLIITTASTTGDVPTLKASIIKPTTISRSLLSVSNEPPQDVAISVDEALDKILDFSAVATDGAQHDWRDTVPRVALFPEPGSVIGVVGKGINQVLGYLAYYRPRLFLAAILIGIYIGWSWQPYIESFLSGTKEG